MARKSAVWASAAFLFFSSLAEAGHDLNHVPKYAPIKHRHLHQATHRSHAETRDQGASLTPSLEKRGGKCQFPSDEDLVSVTPKEENGGWAMSPDEPCEPGSYCPYACPAGMVMAQWDPKAKSYSHPESMVSIII